MIPRNTSITRVAALTVGIFFLNMSFILTELKSLQFDKQNPTYYETIVKLLGSSGMEEEKDASGETKIETENEFTYYFSSARSDAGNHDLGRFHTYVFSFDIRLLTRYDAVINPPPEISV